MDYNSTEQLKVHDLGGIRDTCKRLKEEGMPVPESALRRWVKEGLIPAMSSGRRIFLYYPNVVEVLQKGMVQRQKPEAAVMRGIRRIG